MDYREEPKVVSFGGAARHLSSTPRVVKALVMSGALVGVRLPGRKRYSGVTMQSLEKLIADSTVDGKVGGAE